MVFILKRTLVDVGRSSEWKRLSVSDREPRSITRDVREVADWENKSDSFSPLIGFQLGVHQEAFPRYAYVAFRTS